jgi:hypothetical protein
VLLALFVVANQKALGIGIISGIAKGCKLMNSSYTSIENCYKHV